MPLNDDDDDDGHHHGDLEAMVPEEFHLAASAMGRGGSGERGGTPIDRWVGRSMGGWMR